MFFKIIKEKILYFNEKGKNAHILRIKNVAHIEKRRKQVYNEIKRSEEDN